jgi:diguanylate cyclase (GGDEF)-like protein/PAS domain S-box-containing protein
MSHPVRSFSAAAGLALALGLMTTAILFSGVRRLEQARIASDFGQRGEAYIATIEDGFQSALEVLSDTNRLFATFGTVDNEQFRAFTAPILARHPYIRALDFHRLVAETERAAYEERMRQRYPQFVITELRDGRPVPAASRPRHNVVEYMEPLEGNERAFGIDAFHVPSLRAAFDRAVDSGQPAASDFFQLAQVTGGQRGFAYIFPVYRPGSATDDVESRRANVIGDTAAIFHLDQLMTQVMHAGNITDVDIRLYAAEQADDQHLVFHTGSDDGHAGMEGLLYKPPKSVSRTFTVAGKSWHIVLAAPTEAFSLGHRASLITLCTGILMSILASLWIQTLVSRARHVQQLVALRTTELQIANRRMHEDITARQRAEQALRLYERAIESSANAIVIVRANGTIFSYDYVNPAFTRITGYTAEEALHRHFGFTHADLPGEQAGRAELRAAMTEQREGRAVLPGVRKDGTHYWTDAYVSPVRNEDDSITHHVLILHDVTRTRMYEEELAFQANSDALTGLANRSLLRDRLKQAIAYASGDGNPIWVVFIDLDRFKLINDTLGYQAGDKLLMAIARRLEGLLLDTDTAARFSGDEYALILTERNGRPLTTEVLQRLMETIRQPLNIDGHDIVLTCSIGVTVYPHDGSDAETLIQHADLAMFRAKQEGHDRFRFFTPIMNEQALHRLRLEGDLRNAIERHEFVLHYQPQFDAQSGELVGCEALIRWQHPELGMVSPMDFIGLAEDTGLITPIGEWVLRTACAQNAAWQRAGVGHFRVAVNMSAPQFAHSDIVSIVAAILDETGLEPQYLEIELTESVVMTNVNRAIGVLSELKQLGVHLSVDDFGTGYSSLAYLKRFPIDVLKIDRSFVRDLAVNPHDEQIVVSIISLAHNLGMKVVGEGVETKEQLAFLQAHRCDIMQGYYFAVPMPVESFERTAALHTPGPPPQPATNTSASI